jgi:hypothetical protein|tara:strand:+ start:103 stop:360 length:258 start_codon:yes stop_codon:yes gene_type:complete
MDRAEMEYESSEEEHNEFSTRMKTLQENAKWTGDYRTVCLARPPDYSFYGKLDISWGNMDSYECHHKLGRGKYSEVYQGCNVINN